MCLQLKYWVADISAQMFDYATKQPLEQKNMCIETSTIVYQDSQNYTIKQTKNMGKNKQNYKQILKIFKIRNRFVVSKIQDGQDLYVVAGNQGRQNGESIEAKQGSLIKLSKSNLQVYRLKYDKRRVQDKNNYQQKIFNEKIYNEIQQKNRIGIQYYQDSTNASTIEQAPCCRYCYQKSIEHSNLLTILCKCEGSTKYVHEECLKSWICMRSRYCEKKQGVYYAQRNGIICQICKQQFDIQQVLPCFKNKEMKQFIVLQIQNQQIGKCFWIFKLNQGEDMQISVGRKFQSSIIIPDLSVSRQHCRFKWNNKSCKLYVQDLDSKFGTLLKKDCIQISKPIFLQLGRTKFLFQPMNQQKLSTKIKKNIDKLIKTFRKSKTQNNQDQITTYQIYKK